VGCGDRRPRQGPRHQANPADRCDVLGARNPTLNPRFKTLNSQVLLTGVTAGAVDPGMRNSCRVVRQRSAVALSHMRRYGFAVHSIELLRREGTGVIRHGQHNGSLSLWVPILWMSSVRCKTLNPKGPWFERRWLVRPLGRVWDFRSDGPAPRMSSCLCCGGAEV
jgi:hypothetical protein